jgi:hypothetical protein
VTTEAPNELGGFEAALNAALEEIDESLGDGPADLLLEEPKPDEKPVEQAPAKPDEQSDEASESASQPEAEDEEELFGDMEETEVEPVAVADLRFDVPGVEEQKSVDELRDGFMRDRDYTQKTQLLAEQRKEHEEAISFYAQIQAQPVEVVTKLAVDAGLIPAGQAPVADVSLSALRTADQVEAEIAERVAKEVSTHPTVQAARIVEMKDQMNKQFSGLETKYETKLGPKSRRRILQEAQKSGTGDLDLVFRGLMAQKQTTVDQAKDLRAAAPGRSTGRSHDKAVDADDAKSIEEAFDFAMISHGD